MPPPTIAANDTRADPRVGAAIDIGSNSIHLLVAAMDEGRARPILDESELLGLGAIVDLEGAIPDRERDTTLDALARYMAAATGAGAEWITLLATEPLRRAANRTHFCDDVERRVGRRLHVLSHEEEALLTLIGVLGAEVPAEPTLIIDIGGGSSEVVLHGPDQDPVVGSIPTGSARLTGAFIEDDPPTDEELRDVRAEARRLAAGLPAGHPSRGIVVGGSGRNLLRLVHSLDLSSAGADDVIDADAVASALRIVGEHPASELIARAGLRERRVRQMAAGAALIEAVMAEYGLDRLEVSDASLREGAIVAVAHAGDRWREHLAELGPGRPLPLA